MRTAALNSNYFLDPAALGHCYEVVPFNGEKFLVRLSPDARVFDLAREIREQNGSSTFDLYVNGPMGKVEDRFEDGIVMLRSHQEVARVVRSEQQIFMVESSAAGPADRVGYGSNNVTRSGDSDMAVHGGRENRDVPFDLMCKIVLVGDTGVGKTCLLARFVYDTFSLTSMATIGIDFQFKTIDINVGSRSSLREYYNWKRVKLQVWDTAGAERFRTITSSYYRGADAVIIVYDVSQRSSFERVQTWLDSVRQHADPQAVLALVGNKCDYDCELQRAVSTLEGQAAAEELGCAGLWFETSARDAVGVDEVFAKTAMQWAREKLAHGAAGQQGARPGSIVLTSERSTARKKCC